MRYEVERPPTTIWPDLVSWSGFCCWAGTSAQAQNSPPSSKPFIREPFRSINFTLNPFVAHFFSKKAREHEDDGNEGCKEDPEK